MKDKSVSNATTTKDGEFVQKLEFGTLHRLETGKWLISGYNAHGKHKRLRFKAESLEKAIQAAKSRLGLLPHPESEEAIPEEKNRLSLLPHPESDDQVDPQSLEIADVFIREMSGLSIKDHTAKNDRIFSKYFLDWVDKKGLRYWKQLRYEHVLEYKKFLDSRGLSYNTVRLYFQPVKRTAKWACRNWPHVFVDFCATLRIDSKQYQPKTYESKKGISYLSLHQVMDFLDYLSRNPKKESLVIGVALQGILGLQLQEVTRLTWDKIHLHEGTLVIEGDVKNSNRIRKLPLPKFMLRLLAKRAGKGTVISNYLDYSSYSRRIKKEMLDWKKNLALPPKDLRNTLQTEANKGKWYGYTVQRFVGHAPQGIGEKHYIGSTPEEQIQEFREEIISKLENMIETWPCPPDSPLKEFL